jgi:hypothetical protein
MDAVSASTAATTTSSTGTPTDATTKATDAKKSFSALFAEAKADLKSGERAMFFSQGGTAFLIRCISGKQS